MTIIEINKKFYTVPTSWNELSQKQLLEVMDTLFIRKYSSEQCLLKLVKILCNMNYFQFFRARPEEMEEFLYLTAFLLEERTELTKQLIPFYKGMYGPDEEFGNLIMQELVFSEDFFMKWSQDKENISLLDQLCAAIYRPIKRKFGIIKYDTDKNPQGDPRVEFNQNICSWRAKHIISKWPLNVKLAISTWYDACRWDLVDSNPEVFGGDGEEVARYGLISVMLSVAEANVLGNFNQVEKQLVNLVMIQLNEGIAKNKAAEKQMKA